MTDNIKAIVLIVLIAAIVYMAWPALRVLWVVFT